MDDFDINLIKKYVPLNKQNKALKRLSTGYPVQYIIGTVDFNGVILNVNKNVLIPRFETELLADKVYKLILKYGYENPNIIDIGTGSGCISIYLKSKLDCDITAIDNSLKALKVAKKNAKINHVNVNFVHKDIKYFKNNNKFDILVSNPPYVGKEEIVDEMTKYEPQNAIFAKNDGLYYYDLILKKSLDLLNRKNLICFECGKSQCEIIKKMASNIYPHANILIEKDLNKYNRYVFIINE